MHSSPWSHLSQLAQVPKMFIAAHELITVPLSQQLHLYSPSLLPLTAEILEDLDKSNSPDIVRPCFESVVTFRAMAEEAQQLWQGPATTLAAAGNGTSIGVESTTIKQHILFPAQTIFSQTVKSLFLAAAVLFLDLVPMMLTVWSHIYFTGSFK